MTTQQFYITHYKFYINNLLEILNTVYKKKIKIKIKTNPCDHVNLSPSPRFTEKKFLPRVPCINIPICWFTVTDHSRQMHTHTQKKRGPSELFIHKWFTTASNSRHTTFHSYLSHIFKSSILCIWRQYFILMKNTHVPHEDDVIYFQDYKYFYNVSGYVVQTAMPCVVSTHTQHHLQQSKDAYLSVIITELTTLWFRWV